MAIWGLLCFYMNCEIFCYNCVENAIGNLIWIIAFGSIVIFTVLILPTQEHGISLYLEIILSCLPDLFLTVLKFIE